MDLGKDPILDIDNLTMDYGKGSVLRSVSMRIFEEQVVAIVGSSGAGKSSFLCCLNQLFQDIPCCSVKGKIKYMGQEVLNAKTNLVKLRREIGMVFQKPNPFPMSIKKNIVLPLKEHGLLNKQAIEGRVEEVLKKVGLWEEVSHRLDHSAMELSGGQQQRLCIARAIALNPRVLLMDEPTSSLDPLATKKIEDLIIKLKEEMTLVIVTHSLSQARRVANQIAFFAVEKGHGKLVEFGQTHQVFSEPQSPLTKEFITNELL